MKQVELAIVEGDKSVFDRLLRNIDKIEEKQQLLNDALRVAFKYISGRHHGFYFATRLIEKGADVNAIDQRFFPMFVMDKQDILAIKIIRFLLINGLKWMPEKKNLLIKQQHRDYINRYNRILPLLSSDRVPNAICYEINRFLL